MTFDNLSTTRGRKAIMDDKYEKKGLENGLFNTTLQPIPLLNHTAARNRMREIRRQKGARPLVSRERTGGLLSQSPPAMMNVSLALFLSTTPLAIIKMGSGCARTVGYAYIYTIIIEWTSFCGGAAEAVCYPTCPILHCMV